MNHSALIIGATYVIAHFLILVPFVPIASLVPTGLGMLAMTSMAVSLVLAARWRVVDMVLGGPDKSYVAHRWLGFFALAGALGHWALASSLESSVPAFLSESGEEVGTLAATGLLILAAASMVRAIPYHLWKASHMLMGPTFVLAAYHTFFVAGPLAVGALPWTVMAVASAVGIVAWFQTLLRRLAPSALVTVSHIDRFDGGVDVTFTSKARLSGFKPGQFATVALNKARAEPHPFTIAGGDDHQRRFIIRAAGDWTDQFVREVKKGDQFRLGSAAGRFLPKVSTRRPEQLWVAGGVGITPFLAALEAMQPDDGARITLVYCVRSRESAGGLCDVEKHDQRLPQLELIVLADEERLRKARVSEIANKLSANAQVYLCGPEGLKAMVTEVWRNSGKTGRVHCERFDFRGALELTDLIYIGKSVVDHARAKGQNYATARS